jgi:hypothetical protein
MHTLAVWPIAFNVLFGGVPPPLSRRPGTHASPVQPEVASVQWLGSHPRKSTTELISRTEYSLIGDLWSPDSSPTSVRLHSSRKLPAGLRDEQRGLAFLHQAKETKEALSAVYVNTPEELSVQAKALAAITMKSVSWMAETSSTRLRSRRGC